MKPLFYILIKSVKNSLLELKRKPAKLIAYILFILLLSMGLIFNRNNNNQHKILDPALFNTIVGVVILLFTAPSLYSSLNNGATFFRGADINLVFTSPTSPQKILAYGFIKQIYTSFIAVFFIVFQGPTLYAFTNIKSYGIIVIMFGLFLMLIFNSTLKILLYAIASKNERNKVILTKIFKFLGIFLIIAYFIELYIIKSPGKAIISLLNNSAISYIPIYGWVRAIIMSSMNGIDAVFFVYIGLIIASGALCSYIIHSIELDYYEDVLATTEQREIAISASRLGEKAFMQPGKKPRLRKVQYNTKGHFASAIFWRQILEYKKTGFALINVGSIIYAVIAITAGLFSPLKDLKLVLGGMIYLQLIFTFASKWQKDLANPYIYMLPDHAFKKVIYSTGVDNIKNIIDGTIVFVIAGVLFNSSLILIIFNIIAFVSIGSLFIYGGILTRRILGSGNNILFTTLTRGAILLLIIAPSIVLLTVLYSVMGMFIAYTAFITYNVIFSSLIIVLGKGVFENIEM